MHAIYLDVTPIKVTIEEHKYAISYKLIHFSPMFYFQLVLNFWFSDVLSGYKNEKLG